MGHTGKVSQNLFCETLLGIVFATQYQIQIKLFLIFAPVYDDQRIQVGNIRKLWANIFISCYNTISSKCRKEGLHLGKTNGCTWLPEYFEHEMYELDTLFTVPTTAAVPRSLNFTRIFTILLTIF